MSNDPLIQSFIATKDALMRRIGDLYGEINICQRDVEHLDEMMARYGARAAMGQPDDQEGEVEVEVEATADDTQSANGTRQSVEEIIRGLIHDLGAVEAARRVTEWLLRTGQILNPSPVKAVFESFPQILRAEYNPSAPTAVEALRQQIRGWVARDGSVLFYQDGSVGMYAEQPKEEVQSR